jgi:glycosyltransferase involved in cell wall biosynthesis
MLALKSLSIPYVTISQLVSEVHWLFLDHKNQKQLNELYKYSKKNYFLSLDNLKIHQMMMADFNSSSSEIIYNPINCSEILSEYPSVQDGFRLAFVGRIECFHKGLDTLLEVVRQDKWKKRNLKITLYGNGPHRKAIESVIEQNNLSNIMIEEFTDNVDKIWADNHGLILPSRMEGQSLSLLEALHCQRMAITTNVGGASEIIIDNKTGFISPSSSISDIDNTMERAWSKKDMWKQMGLDARKMVKNKMPMEASDYFFNLIQGEIKCL